MGHYLPLEEVEHYLIAKGKPLKVLRQEEMGRCQMGILGRCLCPSLVYEIAGLEEGSYCSGPEERRRAFRLGFWLQR